MDEFLNIVFGDYTSFAQLFGYLWFFMIGYLIFGLIETTGRDVNSIKTPKKWSWKFWIKDNWRRYLLTILCSYVLFRFYTEFSGHPFSNFDSITLGIMGDGAAATIKKRIGAIGGDRDKLTTQINTENEEIG